MGRRASGALGAAALCPVLLTASCAAVAGTSSGGAWSAAQEVPGTARLNGGGSAEITSVSCASPGRCTAVGQYKTTGSYRRQAFVVSEVHGTWGAARQVPGLAALNSADYAQVNSVSCPSPGDCIAGGFYTGSSSNTHPFVVSQVRGTWQTAIRPPGMTALNAAGAGQIDSVSCGSPGNCVAAGSEGIDNGYDVQGGGQPLVVTETHGAWGDAQHLPGMAALNTGADGWINSVSCASAGN